MTKAKTVVTAGASAPKARAAAAKKAQAPSPLTKTKKTRASSAGARVTANKPIPPRARAGDPKLAGTNQYAADPAVDPKFTPVTPIVLESFYHALSLCGNVTQVCDELRLSRVYMMDLRRKDPEVRTKWLQAMDDAVEVWEDEAARRAFRGYEKPVYQGGVLVGRITEYSDRLAEMMIKAGRPDKHVAKVASTVEMSGSMGLRVAAMGTEELNELINKQITEMQAISSARKDFRELMGREPHPDDGGTNG